MPIKTFHKLVGIIFAIGATVHLYRLIFGFTVVLGNWNVPQWLSAVIFLALVYLSYTAFKLGGILK